MRGESACLGDLVFDEFDDPYRKLLIHDQQFAPGNESSADKQVNRVLDAASERDDATGIEPGQRIGLKHGRAEFDRNGDIR